MLALTVRSGTGRENAQDVRREPEEGYDGMGTVSRTLLSFIIACQMHILRYIVGLIVGSPAIYSRRVPRVDPLALTAALHTDRHMVCWQRTRQLEGIFTCWWLVVLRCAWWVTFRTFYDFGFLMVTALVGAPFSSPRCPFHPFSVADSGSWLLIFTLK